MGGCSAFGCKNSSKNGFRMFNIPMRSDRQAVWLHFLRREDWKKNPPKSYRNCQVCEAHFADDQYEPNRLDKKLKGSAVPTVFTHSNVPRTTVSRRPIKHRSASKDPVVVSKIELTDNSIFEIMYACTEDTKTDATRVQTDDYIYSEYEPSVSCQMPDKKTPDKEPTNLNPVENNIFKPSFKNSKVRHLQQKVRHLQRENAQLRKKLNILNKKLEKFLHPRIKYIN